jgi:TRAP-type C4-dicarboxylate transport system permease large subunit
MLLTLLFVLVFGLLILGVPIAVALGLSSLVFILLSGQVPDLVVIHRMVNGVDSFPLLAVPFFILAGNLMNTAGITNRIFDFAKACVGWMRGGLGHVNVGASVVFAGMSGAAVADAGGLGTIEIKAMRDAGYDADFSVGVTAASSTIGPILILLMINAILLIVGCFMETIAAITILVPVLLPIVVKLGIDPVHFGVIMVLNLMIGLLTPPVGMVIYVLSRVSGVPFERCVTATMPFLIPLVAVLLLVTFVPQLSMFLPTLLYR